MSKTAQWIINYCQKIVIDDGNRWGQSWIPFINAGQWLIADVFPSAMATTVQTQLVPGVNQSCPADSIRFLGLTNNGGVAGLTPGPVISLCDEESLSAFSPSWMAATASTTIENYMFDENEPTKFRVTPPVHASTAVYVGIRHVPAPTDCTTSSSSLSVPDKFLPALAEWCLYLALNSETDARDPNKANAHLTNFFNMMGVKQANRLKYTPNIQERAGIVPAEAQ
jgi:hypothetical protein